MVKSIVGLAKERVLPLSSKSQLPQNTHRLAGIELPLRHMQNRAIYVPQDGAAAFTFFCRHDYQPEMLD